MKILHLTLKKKWFDMIFSGEKKEEYREIKKYWIKRLIESDNCSEIPNHITIYSNKQNYKHYDIIIFKNGYSNNAPTIKIEFKGVEIKEGNNKWGAPDYKVFAIKLGRIIETSNYN